MPEDRAAHSVRTMLLAVIGVVLVQAGIGMVVNLYVTVPRRHPGAHPSSYFAGSYRSVAWAITHGTAILAVHAALGLALAVIVAAVFIHATRARNTAVAVWCALGGLLVIGAGFNGSSFLDFNDSISSLIMALLGFGSIACYAAALFLAGGQADRQ
jgi:hypothetical protein